MLRGIARGRRVAVRRWRLVQSRSRAVLSLVPEASGCPPGLDVGSHAARPSGRGPLRWLPGQSATRRISPAISLCLRSS
jgi:hypothetical protein